MQEKKIYMGLDTRNLVFGVCNNKDADQPVQSDQHFCYLLIGSILSIQIFQFSRSLYS